MYGPGDFALTEVNFTSLRRPRRYEGGTHKPTFTCPMALIAYLRVSTGKQQVSGLGLDAQREAVERYAASSGQTIRRTFLEVESGSVAARPQLQEALAVCKRCRDTLLIARLDRLSRSLAFVARLLEAGVDVRAADVPEANRLTLQLLAVFAEHERQLIRERTRAALASAKARGTPLGRNGVRLAEAHRAAAVKFATELRGAVELVLRGGAVNFTQVAGGLNSAGVPSRDGGRWHATSARRLLGRLGIDLAVAKREGC